MKVPLESILFVVFLPLLGASVPAAVQSEDGLWHYFGSKSRTQIELRAEESEDGPTYLHLIVYEPNDLATRADTRMPIPEHDRKTTAGIALSGTARLHGNEIRYRANLSGKRDSLEILEPGAVLLADGSKLELAGKYGALSEDTRADLARAAFERVDKEMNVLYGKIIATLDPQGQEELRSEQRRWLKYRDFTVYDGDNAETAGPGKAPYLRQQGLRTLERIDFLKSLPAKPPQDASANSFYSDGRGGSFAIRRADDIVLFSARVCHPELRAAAPLPRGVPCQLGGVARPSDNNTWVAKTEDMVAEDDETQPEALRLVFEPTGHLRIEAVENGGHLAPVFGGKYRWQRATMPAEEPVRSLLCQLPEKAFEETTEGLAAADAKSLALTGTGGTFKIETETPDGLVLRHHDGTVELRRWKGDDGAAVLAVEQTNGRNHLMQLWKKARGDEPFKLWENALPNPPVGRFFAEDPGDDAAKIKEHSRQVILFEKESAALRLHLDVSNLENWQPDFSFVLEWDGYGFAHERQRK